MMAPPVSKGCQGTKLAGARMPYGKRIQRKDFHCAWDPHRVFKHSCANPKPLHKLLCLFIVPLSKKKKKKRRIGTQANSRERRGKNMRLNP